MVCYTTPMPNQEETPLPPPTFSSADIEIEKTETAPLSEPLVPEAAPVKQARKTPEKKRSPAKPLTGPTPPLSSGAEKAQKAPVVPETPKTLEARRDTTLSAYFKKVKTGTDFLQRVIDMPDHAKLCRGLNMEVAEMAQFSGKLYQQVLDFFVAFEASKETKSAGELASTGEVFISSAQIPSGCQRAIRAVVHADILKKLGLAVETPAVPPEAKTAKTKSETLPLKPVFEGGDGGRGGGEAAETSPLSRLLTPEEIVASQRIKMEREALAKKRANERKEPAPAPSSTSETRVSASSPKEEPKPLSFLEKLRLRTEKREKIPSPPPVPPKETTPVTSPPSASPTPETAPPAPPEAESTPTPPTIQPQATETASEKKDSPLMT
ncbi:MAG: hypothetical protein UY62_C0046G0007 [Parcubacteria group bacterium GW2011_GWF2_50_9]|nr:MAG: hypothetical protein UY62_C0046G0007 [Parcubacteria group bacterium GW2011_GWF2_50_9]